MQHAHCTVLMSSICNNNPKIWLFSLYMQYYKSSKDLQSDELNYELQERSGTTDGRPCDNLRQRYHFCRRRCHCSTHEYKIYQLKLNCVREEHRPARCRCFATVTLKLKNDLHILKMYLHIKHKAASLRHSKLKALIGKNTKICLKVKCHQPSITPSVLHGAYPYQVTSMSDQ